MTSALLPVSRVEENSGFVAAVTADLEERHYGISLGEQRRVSFWEQECEAIRTGRRGRVVPALRALAAAAERMGYPGSSFARVRARYYMWVRDRDWRVFLDRRRGRASKLSAETVAYFHGLCLENQRKCAPAWRELVRRWRAGTHIPGLGTWQTYWASRGVTAESCPPELPAGLSKSTLDRAKPTKAALALARQGIAAAREHTLHIIGTREGLRPLEYIAFDDVELDFLCLVPGVAQPCRLRALVAKDVATDMFLTFVLRPALEREDGAKDGLKTRDMKRLVARLLMHFGVPKNYQSHWIVERGTATIYPEDERALSQVTRGLVEVHRTSMIAGRVLVGGDSDQPVGSSWSKAWIESGFNLLHNELGAVPGQKGRRYDLAPRRLEVAKRRATELMKAGAELPAELRAALALPFPDVHAAHRLIADAMLRISSMPGHKCEGFAQQARWRLMRGDAWHTEAELLDLPPSAQDAVRTRGEWTREVETRLERWIRLGGPSCAWRVPAAAIHQWLDIHKPVSVERGRIAFKHEGRTLTFARAGDALLREGAAYLGWFDPDFPDKLHLTQGDGAAARYVGWLPAWAAVRRGDRKALADRFAEKTRALNAAIDQVRSGDDAVGGPDRRTADIDRNINVLSEGAALMGTDIAPSDPTADEHDPAPVVVSMLDEQGGDRTELADERPESEWTPEAIESLLRD